MEESIQNFQLEEYKNISNAHFETNKQIGIFFRYFLLIASTPAVIFVWFGKNGEIFSEILTGQNYYKNVFIAFFLFFISIIGLFFCFYLIGLRLDSILYARTVNGVRKYFYKQNIDFESHYRILPTQTNVPKYKQKHTFSIIVYSLSLINAAYFAIGTYLIAIVGTDFFTNFFPIKIPIIFPNYTLFSAITSSLVFFFTHIVYYSFISNYRNYSYLKNLTIGIDIDGVLNKHRDTFCTLLYEKTKKTLWADEITNIPVHLIPNIKEEKNISREDEFLIFNDIKYWDRQVSINPKIGKIIKELKDVFGYRIHIFSYRPWPDTAYLPKHINKKDVLKSWWFIELPSLLNVAPMLKFFIRKKKLFKRRKLFFKMRKIELPLFSIISKSNWYSRRARFFAIQSITKRWLRFRKIPYNKITIERNSIDVKSVKLGVFKIPKNSFKNRFYYSHKKAFRYFVEDDVNNAIKLCGSCEYVFLMSQPYNKLEEKNKPSNLILVKSWSEIKEKIKELG